MKYDPIKQSLGNVFNRHPILRIVFYRLLDTLLLRTWHIKKEIGEIRNYLPDIPEILDAGSGFGQYSYYLAKKFPQGIIHGIDIKEKEIKECNNFSLSRGLSERLLFSNEDLTGFRRNDTYNLIITVDVMEHISEDIKVLGNFYASLRKGGFLLISTPSDQGGSDVHDEEDSSFIDEHVRNGYSIKDINDKLHRVGFTNISARYSYGFPGKLSWKLSMKYPVSMINFSKLSFVILPFYYLLTFPFCLLLNLADVRMKHVSGTGLIVKAIK